MEKCNKMYSSICRVCLKQCKVESMVSLEEKPGRRSLITFGKVLVRFARISIDYDDILPTKICQNCKQMIQNINSFKLMCKNNDRKLRKFINLAQNDSGKYKAMICEYTMFCQYFPREGFKSTRSSPATARFQKKMDKIKTKNEKLSPVRLKSETDHESDGDYSYNIPFDDKQIEPRNDTENVDLFLDSLEKAVKTKMKHNFAVKNKQKGSSNIKNIDSMLDSIEKAVNTRIKCSNIETNTKPLYVPLKNFHCDICNRTLANRPNYNYHMQRHTNVCNATYATNKTVRRHMIAKHGIPRDKQGKITRITKDSNSINMGNRNETLIASVAVRILAVNHFVLFVIEQVGKMATGPELRKTDCRKRMWGVSFVEFSN
ncbi:Uncharacterized protein OBRU01_18833 [Operophtera brumata]|uniref:Uncharacterized protein n=1 Tax=Operophtera brumata TaxID=104452 RepID=A0A0L7KYC5_OPEBR|nr:Uncharacterized protein OBRU01_18833 [Operophtera brumata]